MKTYSEKPEIKAIRKKYMKDYHKNRLKKDKDKISDYKKKYYVSNKEKIDKNNNEWMEKNKDKFADYRKVYDKINKDKLLDYGKKWYHSRDKKEYRRKKNIWEKNKSETDVNYNIKRKLRVRVWHAFQRYIETGKIMNSKEYGINYSKIIKKLIDELPKDFNDMNYEIDHIKPLCSFDLRDLEQVKIAFAPENHQWLEENIHREKSKKDIKKKIKLQALQK